MEIQSFFFLVLLSNLACYVSYQVDIIEADHILIMMKDMCLTRST